MSTAGLLLVRSPTSSDMRTREHAHSYTTQRDPQRTRQENDLVRMLAKPRVTISTTRGNINGAVPISTSIPTALLRSFTLLLLPRCQGGLRPWWVRGLPGHTSNNGRRRASLLYSIINRFSHYDYLYDSRSGIGKELWLITGTLGAEMVTAFGYP